ncbi:hypothetical protein OIU85_011837 [Salix viminalis]|uniref:Uncharacterized protein n=1 Tax=Salix viminalis TaxID=40686 RepID=A0A9Q0NTN4_SALVM|nr:hypothetical protein OIU85_011837 [Salix viminalis]
MVSAIRGCYGFSDPWLQGLSDQGTRSCCICLEFGSSSEHVSAGWRFIVILLICAIMMLMSGHGVPLTSQLFFWNMGYCWRASFVRKCSLAGHGARTL